jgi:superfamily I DNA/RNA helicase
MKIAVSYSFLDAYTAIPNVKKRKVKDFLSRFQNNPTSSGINYEVIHNASDSNMKSVRIDRDYRGIVYKPQSGNVYLLLWVDKHDDAYRWASTRRCEINDNTGTIQLYELLEGFSYAEPDTPAVYPSALFERISKNHLLRMGLPEKLYGFVKSIKSRSEFEDKKKYFPGETYEALSFIADGDSPEEVINALFLDELSSEIDSTDFHAALEKAGTRQEFFVVDEEKERELQEILSAPLERWRIFLHKSQRRMVEQDFSGPVRVLGGAGTGKTVVALHRAKYLAENIFTRPDDKILFTTFTKNLAEDIKNNLKKICSSEVMKRIEVVNIDRWINDYLKSTGASFDIVYGKAIDDCWDNVLKQAPDGLTFNREFYKREWERVIATQDIRTLETYLRCPRTGRGKRLTASARKMIWKVIEAFKLELFRRKIRDIEAMTMQARRVIQDRADVEKYAAVIVDESQDFRPQEFMLLRELMGGQKRNDLFIVGDAHQRIYGHKFTLKKCGVRIQGRSSILKINYRTTEETRNWAFSILDKHQFDDMDDGVDSGKGYKSLINGPEPEIIKCANLQEEVNTVFDKINQLVSNGTDIRNICITFRTKRYMDEFSTLLNNKGMKVYRISSQKAEDRNIEYVRVATMHRVKGLEFEYVFIANANHDVIPFKRVFGGVKDNVLKQELETAERSLLYVASTRAKKALFVTYSGRVSPFVS